MKLSQVYVALFLLVAGTTVDAASNQLPNSCKQLSEIADTCYAEFDDSLSYRHPDQVGLYKAFLIDISKSWNDHVNSDGDLDAATKIKFQIDEKSLRMIFVKLIQNSSLNIQFFANLKGNEKMQNPVAADEMSMRMIEKSCVDMTIPVVQGISAQQGRVQMLTGSKAPKCVKVMSKIKL